jgi:V/A-type H+-transporting ATPase subunit I
LAKLDINKIEIAARLEDLDSIIKLLQKKGAVEISKPKEYLNKYGLKSPDETTGIEAIDRNIALLDSAYSVLTPYKPKTKTSLFSARPIISEAEYIKRSSDISKILDAAEKAINFDKKINEDLSKQSADETKISQLSLWINYDLPLDYAGDKRFSILLGSVPREENRDNILSLIKNDLPNTDAFECDIISATAEMTTLAVYCISSDRDKIEASLRNYGFSLIQNPVPRTAKEEIDLLNEEINNLSEDIDKNKSELSELGKNYFSDIELIYDHFLLQRERLSAVAQTAQSGKIFILSGFAVASKSEKLKKEIESKYSAAVELSIPSEEDDPPVELKNNGFSSPLEWITEMYSYPGKNDVDPTPIYAFFYYFFFGMMFSDAGYGLIMTIACAVLLIKGNLEDDFKQKVKMFMYCGISTVFWGAMYGSWFGDLPVVIATTFGGAKQFSMALWMDPLSNLLKVLVVCFIFGLVHLFTGVFVNGYNLLKHGHKFDAFCETIPQFVFVIGIAPIFFGLFTEVPEWMTKAGTPLIIIGALLVVLTAGRKSKSIGGKLGEGLYALYNLISGYLGDVLSYARLLALGLSTGVIAQVINMLGTLPKSMPMKAVLLTIVAIFGHIANLLINVIGAYVHTNRLQYVEFFGKFYEGGGRKISPLKYNTKYYRIMEEKKS